MRQTVPPNVAVGQDLGGGDPATGVDAQDHVVAEVRVDAGAQAEFHHAAVAGVPGAVRCRSAEDPVEGVDGRFPQVRPLPSGADEEADVEPKRPFGEDRRLRELLVDLFFECHCAAGYGGPDIEDLAGRANCLTAGLAQAGDE
ncbi:hypothetical protein [Nonomuraea wenchangensis]|uniref:hypothetical protein n=1 Tax=Nonomuraea wenchangensis TaxID=568860 RepID=UPI00340D348A